MDAETLLLLQISQFQNGHLPMGRKLQDYGTSVGPSLISKCATQCHWKDGQLLWHVGPTALCILQELHTVGNLPKGNVPHSLSYQPLLSQPWANGFDKVVASCNGEALEIMHTNSRPNYSIICCA